MNKITFNRSLMLLVLSLSFAFVSKAQVYNGNLILNSQAAVDAFNYTEVTGYLYVGPSAPPCPGANDGYIIINPSCSTCTGIEYSIDGTTYQSSNEFLNVSPGTYTLYARDVGNPDCLSTVNTLINPGYDNEPPAVNCKNIEVCLEPGLNVMITPQDVLTSVTDNCGVDENSFNVFPNNFSATGTFNVTVYASDVNGNQGSCNATVTVNLESTSPTTIEADVNDVCTGQTINLTASGGVSGTGADVVWYDGPNGTGNMLGTGSGISVTPATTTTYYARREGVCNNTADASLTITVGDNTAPVLTVISTPITLWPPNHKYETITMDQLFVSVSDNCATLTMDDVYIESVSSDEPDNGDNDGNTTEDILFGGDDCSSVQLRRERYEYGNGRVYTINLAVDDGNGNTGTANVEVYVPIGNNQSATNDGADHTETCTNSKSSILANGSLNDVQLVNYPNPFSNKTTIEFSAAYSGRTSLKVYNSVGYLVATLYEGYAEAGQTYKVDFDGSSLSKGMYFYDLQTVNGVHKMKKMILMK